MSPRAKLVLDFIRAYIKRHGIAPSYETITRAFGLKSRSNIYRLVKVLEDEGFVKTRPRKFYSIKLVDQTVDDVVKL